MYFVEKLKTVLKYLKNCEVLLKDLAGYIEGPRPGKNSMILTFSVPAIS